MSVLFFVGSRVYKLKKPVKLDYLDLSSPADRERACRREVELNRRLAPDVYLGVAEVRGVPGNAPEHLVVMRRMPEQRSLASMVRAGADVGPCVRGVARTIAAFHARADTSAEIAAAASLEQVRANWESGFATMAPFTGTVVDETIAARVTTLARRYLDGRAPLFRRRIAEGAARDGHGDLLADDIFCLDDGPRILDCLEFDDRLRWCDVLADVCFLAMDLERVGAPAPAEQLLTWYAEFSGSQHPVTLAHHYTAYRAHVRAKVACLRSAQGDPSVAADARQLLAIAHDHLQQGRVVLTLVGGFPGTGKSTLASDLGAARGWTVLRSDEVRKDIAGIGHTERRTSSYGEGLYDARARAETYLALLDRARSLLAVGEPVIIDASWTDSRWRAEARRVADETHSDLVELRCAAPIEVARARIEARSAAGHDASDATLEVLERMAADDQPWPSAVAIETGSGRAPARDAALAALAALADDDAGGATART